jgi:hypothetical protein
MSMQPLDPSLRHVIGLDLGKLSDPSALALLEWRVGPLADQRKRDLWGKIPWEPGQKASIPGKPVYDVPTLKRWPLGMAYTQISADVIRFLRTEPLTRSEPLLVVDSTGVGVAVCEMLLQEIRRYPMRGGFVAVTITAGSAVTHSGDSQYRVAKKALASTLQVLLGYERLRIAPGLREAPTLARELATFTVKVTEAANESFESWRERDHDDLVLAVALAAWAAEKLPWPPKRNESGPLLLIT